MKNELYFFILGCKPKDRLTEQHDVFITIAENISQIESQLINFWPEADETLHIDSWRKVSNVNGYKIEVDIRDIKESEMNNFSLFFINLGGYKKGDLEEYHYKEFIVAKDKAEAIALAKETAFYKHTGFKGAQSHIDDKYGIDVDGLYNINEILPPEIKQKYSLVISKSDGHLSDELNIGYLTMSKLRDMK